MTNPKHTTAEYLEWIDREYEMSELRDKRRYDNGLSHDEDGYRASLLANRDVLKRHHYDINFVDGVSEVCAEDYDPFPCDTRKDIAQRLDEVM